MRRVSSQSCRPLQRCPPQLPAIGINSRTTSWQAFNGKSEPPAPEINGENECRSFESAKNAEENKPAPTNREGGKEWAKPESSGALPKPLEACDRSLFYPSTREIGSLCLIHSWTVSDSNSYLCRDAVKHIRIEWFLLHTQAHTYTYIIYSTCTLDVLNTSCAVGLFYYAAWNCRHVCSYMTSSYFIYAQGFSILSIDIPDVEPLNSPLCNNLFKALVLEGQRSRETYAVGPASPDSPNPPPPPLLPTLYCCLTTSSQTPTPSQLICHLHSSLQDNSNEPKESTSKVWTDSATRTFSRIVSFVYNSWQQITHSTCLWLPPSFHILQ